MKGSYADLRKPNYRICHKSTDLVSSFSLQFHEFIEIIVIVLYILVDISLGGAVLMYAYLIMGWGSLLLTQKLSSTQGLSIRFEPRRTEGQRVTRIWR